MIAKRVVQTAYGGPEVIAIKNFEVPEPGDTQVLVKVIYAGIAYADIMLKKTPMPGMPKPPRTPGADFTGIVEKTGGAVTKVKPGDRVAGISMSDFGAQAQFVCIDEQKLYRLPDTVPLGRGVCLLINYLTAYGMFREYEARSKGVPRSILVHGGSGGVGSALIQIAAQKGIEVFSTASADNIAFVESMGAVGIDYRTQDFVREIKTAGGSVDAVFDPISGDYLPRSLRILARGGVYVAFGFQKSAGIGGMLKAVIMYGIRKITALDKTLMIYQLTSHPESMQSDLDDLFSLYAQKRVSPHVSAVFPLEEAAAAYAALENGRRQGKIILQANKE